MDRLEKIKERLAKLKALSKSPNQNEMLLSISKMKTILKENGLTEADIPDIETEVIKVERVEIVKLKKGKYADNLTETRNKSRALKDWEKCLASAIALAYDSVCTFKKSTLAFYGFKEDVYVAKEMYAWVVEAMKKEAKKMFALAVKDDPYLNSITYQQSFMMGVTEAIEFKAMEILEEKRELSEIEAELLQTETIGTSLAVVKQSKIKEAIGDTNNVNLSYEAVDYNAKLAGQIKGSEISLRKQVKDRTIRGALE